MLWIFLLQLINSVRGLSGADHETLCTSNTCFTIHMDRVSYALAQQNCTHNGGYMMTIRDTEEENVLRSLLSQIKGQRQDRVLEFWIGLKLNRGNCTLADKTLRGFKWASGQEDSQYSNWGEEPVSTCTERCVRVNYTLVGQNQLKWTAGACKSLAFYACKFYFKGMCKPLALMGSGEITYTVPFSERPARSDMKSFPKGTYADIICSDQKLHYSVCTASKDIYRWTVPGPFCKTGEQNCAINNGGCKDSCHQDGGEVKCFCREGYDLDEDGLSCRIKDLCSVATCEHQCVMEESGYSCKCPHGFKLDENQRNCFDIDECQSQACEDHLCVNTPGSYTCECKDGYEMVDGECIDVDECAHSRCEHGCLNNIGSFSCYCNQGFTLSQDGFSCPCPGGFHLETDGSACAPDGSETSATPSDDPADEGTHENFTWSLTRTTLEVQHQSPHTDSPLPDLVNVTHIGQQSNVSLPPSWVNSRLMVCVLGSVIPLLVLVTVTLAIAIFRCSRSKKEAKNKTTTDGYCWVSSGLDPRLEKLYESISTDDL
ncbi:complement component C1q receptor-like [Hippoglossus hippoglossus]|uniref:complement component C1q receptor-like n=1 Tax=Hippoglossus hippoglossus TaxID=8267 RepID=UPI00148C97DD|nr:complement component C1q receptor-like [Hippoglossus hippoglossus]